MGKSTIKVGDNTIAVYESAGSGPAVLLIHGNSCSAKSFQHQLDGSMGEKYRIVAIDLPGHGNSSHAADPKATYSIGGFAEAVLGVVAQLGLEKAVIVGWSLAGHIVLEAADRLPDAAGFMIFGAPPLGLPPAMGEAFLPNPAMGAAFSPELTDEQIDGLTSAFLRPNGAGAQFFKDDVARTDGNARAMVGAAIMTNDFKDELEIVADLKTPLAILQGADEQLVNPAYFAGINMPSLWRGSVQIVANAGHALHWEQPEQFNSLLEAFIQETAA